MLRKIWPTITSNESPIRWQKKLSEATTLRDIRWTDRKIHRFISLLGQPNGDWESKVLHLRLQYSETKKWHQLRPSTQNLPRRRDCCTGIRHTIPLDWFDVHCASSYGMHWLRTQEWRLGDWGREDGTVLWFSLLHDCCRFCWRS